jgi:capsular exopolysaccharide synthesis family protein
MMSRVYRALEKAEEEKKKKLQEDSSLGVLEAIEVSKIEKPVLKIHSDKARSPGLLPKEETPVLTIPPKSFAEEEFRKMKSQIFHRLPAPPHSILVTSAVPQEGKTLVAVNLAVAISKEIQRKAVLIDADLRKPGIRLGKNRTSKGLSDYLADGTPFSEILIDTEVDHLQVITAGSQATNPSELIGSKRMEEFLKDACRSGESAYLVIDSSPIISTTEPTMLSHLVDGVILVIMADRTHKEYVQRALKSIDRQKIIGVVLNQVDATPSNYYSRYYYEYYRK